MTHFFTSYFSDALLEDLASKLHRLFGMYKWRTVKSAEKIIKEGELQGKTTAMVVHSAGSFEGNQVVVNHYNSLSSDNNKIPFIESITFVGSPLAKERINNLKKHPKLIVYYIADPKDSIPCAGNGGIWFHTTLPYFLGGEYDKCQKTINPTNTDSHHNLSSYTKRVAANKIFWGNRSLVK